MKRFTYMLLNITFALAVLCTVAMPFCGKYVNMLYGYDGWRFVMFIALITISGVFASALLYNLKVIYKSLALNNPFVVENVTFLNRIAVCCGLITLCYIIKSIFLFRYRLYLL